MLVEEEEEEEEYQDFEGRILPPSPRLRLPPLSPREQSSSSGDSSPVDSSLQSRMPTPALSQHRLQSSSLCPICLEDMFPSRAGQQQLVDQQIVITNRCKHCFHYKCIARWLLTKKSTCPICRTNIIA